MLALLLAVTLATPLPTNPPVCVKYYHDACSEALGEWLPGFGFSSDFWDVARRISQRDTFVYKGEHTAPAEVFGTTGPGDGTFFVYGDAGPPRGHVVYDYEHHITFYEQGCCSWQDVVLAYASPPPKPVVQRNLMGLHTERGIYLDMSMRQVTRIYGVSKLQPIAHQDNMYVLAYTTWPPRKDVRVVRMPCGQFENFYFRNDRLVLIQLGNGC
ncbi:MAG TPA: hypothetical protein VMB20_08560 [Candidatus Acidoferrum sp.]|nr:hypothetical protein [Candidatus Acidoferrum sp.]